MHSSFLWGCVLPVSWIERWSSLSNFAWCVKAGSASLKINCQCLSIDNLFIAACIKYWITDSSYPSSKENKQILLRCCFQIIENHKNNMESWEKGAARISFFFCLFFVSLNEAQVSNIDSFYKVCKDIYLLSRILFSLKLYQRVL